MKFMCHEKNIFMKIYNTKNVIKYVCHENTFYCILSVFIQTFTYVMKNVNNENI